MTSIIQLNNVYNNNDNKLIFSKEIVIIIY